MDDDSNAVIVSSIRLIPFDLGGALDTHIIESIKSYFAKKNINSTLSHRSEIIMEECFFEGYVMPDVRFNIFTTGIVVITILEDPFRIDDGTHFSVNYNELRKKAHKELFSWSHRCSSAIQNFIADLRSIAHQALQTINISGRDDFQNKGMSYVMTVSFYEIEGYTGLYTYPKLPSWFKKNIAAILDPSLLYLEDSSILSNYEAHIDTCKLIDEIEPNEDMINYDSRKNIMALMSWSAVMVVGNASKQDRNDYIDLEINLQSEWYNAYCISENIPRSLEEADNKKMNSIDIQKMINHVETLVDSIYVFDDSSIPFRIVNINRGLVQTSGLKEMLESIIKRLNHLLNLMALEDRERQKKYASTNEILLLIIAVMQILPILEGRLSSENMWLSTIAIVTLIAVGTILIIVKNKSG